MAGFDVPWTEILNFFLTSHIDLDIVEIIVNKMFLQRKVGVTECPRSLNPGKAAAVAIFLIIVHFLLSGHAHA